MSIKKVFAVIIIILLIVSNLIVSSVMAENESEKIFNNCILEYSSDKQHVLSAFEESKDKIMGCLRYEGIESPISTSEKTAYKVYDVDTQKMRDYNKDGSFNYIISDKYYWELLLYNKEMQVIGICRIKFFPDENIWKQYSLGVYFSPDNIKEKYSNYGLLASVANNDEVIKADDIKIVRYANNKYFYYISSEEREYLVALESIKEGITSEKMYQADEFIDIIKESKPVRENPRGDRFYGGVTAAVEAIYNNVIISATKMFIIGIFILAITIAAVLYRRIFKME